jgi:hypothetical protein
MPNSGEHGEPGCPPPSPTRLPEPGQDPLPEPVRVPPPDPDDIPPMNEPLGIPGGLPPEIVPSGTGKGAYYQGCLPNMPLFQSHTAIRIDPPTAM